MNKVILVGNLTKDIELTTTNSGIAVARFSLAVQRPFTNENGERETDFPNCVVWRKQADNLAKYCHKGDKIGVVGSVQTRSYESTDGTKKYVTEILAESIEFINTKKDDGKPEEKKEAIKPATEVHNFEPIDDADLPF